MFDVEVASLKSNGATQGHGFLAYTMAIVNGLTKCRLIILELKDLYFISCRETSCNSWPGSGSST